METTLQDAYAEVSTLISNFNTNRMIWDLEVNAQISKALGIAALGDGMLPEAWVDAAVDKLTEHYGRV